MRLMGEGGMMPASRWWKKMTAMPWWEGLSLERRIKESF